MQVRFRTSSDGTVIGACHLPTSAGGVITVAGIGDSRTEALANAARIAERIASDPVLSAVLPPQALPAIKAVKGLAAASKLGPRALRAVWSRLSGPGKQRLAAALAEDHGGAEVAWHPFWRRRRKRVARPVPRPPQEETEQDEGQDEEQLPEGGMEQ
jgi:cytochrome c551/c552